MILLKLLKRFNCFDKIDFDFFTSGNVEFYNLLIYIVSYIKIKFELY